MFNKSFRINNVVRASTFHFMNKQQKEKIFYLVFTNMQMYGPMHESRTLPYTKCQIFFGTAFYM